MTGFLGGRLRFAERELARLRYRAERFIPGTLIQGGAGLRLNESPV
jgi:hypothetical protein